ncbi:MAG: type II secretion system F family protein [Hyphomicrobiaceae bacterium]|nr:type II secretion system F family protein [Hyphomicrobiaceae bacterium]
MIDTEFINFIFKTETLVTIVASLGVFATVVTFIIPFLEIDRTSNRIRAMAIERNKMLSARLKASKNGTESVLIRHNAHGFMRDVVDKFNLKAKFENDELINQLKMAGLHGQAPIYCFVFFRMIMPPIVMIAALFYLFATESSEKYSLITKLFIAAISGAFGYYLPNIFIKNRIQKRKNSIKHVFPDALDMLLICVQSGMSIEAAFGRVAKEISTQSLELSEELSLTTAELAYLPERKQAYKNLGIRTGVDTVQATATALVQSENYGTPVGQALRVLAKENRDLRITEAEKKAAALPPKLTVPMIVFFLPGLFVIIIGPAIISLMKYF